MLAVLLALRPWMLWQQAAPGIALNLPMQQGCLPSSAVHAMRPACCQLLGKRARGCPPSMQGAWNEGGKGPSWWDTLTHNKALGRTPNNVTGDLASDFYHRWHQAGGQRRGVGASKVHAASAHCSFARYYMCRLTRTQRMHAHARASNSLARATEDGGPCSACLLQDVQLLRALGVRNFRFSISWSRLFPSGTGELNQASAARVSLGAAREEQQTCVSNYSGRH